MKVLVACHAGPGIGLGHLTRSLRIASAMSNSLQADVEILVQGPVFAHDELQAWTHRFVATDDAMAAALNGPDLLLLDLMPGREPTDLGELLAKRRRGDRRTVAIDGLLQYRAALDLTFLPSFQFTPPANLSDGAPILFGWDCLLLDPRPKLVPWIADANAERQVPVLTGGSDASGLGVTWPALLDAGLPADTRLNWVTGPFAQPPCWPGRPRIRAVEHRSPSGLAPLMQASRYAATVFGVSFFELLSHGIPTVVFSPYGDKDAAALRGLADAGVALVARDARQATAMLAVLMQDDALAQRLSRKALDKLSVNGGDRLARAVESWKH